jgi:mono/diheme cytochrome c family protein
MRLLIRLLAVGAICHAGTAVALALGEAAPALALKDIRYLARGLDDFGAPRAFCLVFFTRQDPQADAHWRALDGFQKTYTPGALAAAMVNVGANDTIMEIAADAISHGVKVPPMKDFDAAAARALGVTQTPTVVILDAERRLQYRGDLNYAAAALAAVMQCHPPAVPENLPEGTPLVVPVLPEPAAPVTYAEQVAPILDRHCVTCHRPGAAAPFSLRNYRQAASNAAMIAEVVREERMPPWYALPGHGPFVNARRLDEADRLAIAQWVAGGAPEGDPAQRPAPPEFPDIEWRIGTPDLVITASEVERIPATGLVAYRYLTLPYQFPEETWIQGLEILPGNPDVVHHANVAYVLPEKGYDGNNAFLTGYVPGGAPVDLTGPLAMRIPKGAVLMLQVHYVTTGKEETDQIRVGIRYAKERVQKRVHYKILRPKDIAIPPGDPLFPLGGERTLERDATLIALFAHMHLRGRDMTFTAQTPDGEEETLLVIPNYNFDWQMPYAYAPGAKQLPAGTVLRTRAHFDNSAFNPYNPDPGATVPYGDQTHHEMCDAYVFFWENDEALDLDVDPATGIARG